MKYVLLCSLLFAHPAMADTCEDFEKLVGDYRLYVMGMFELNKACEGVDSKQCRLVRNIDKLVRKDGDPVTAGSVFLIDLNATICR